MGMEWIVGGLIGIGAIIAVLYNRLVALRQNWKNAFADVEVQLKQRQDLIPNLVETVKGYAAHESDVLKSVTEARAKAAGAQTVSDKVVAENQLSKALMNVLAVAENYPQLKADQNFAKLQAELSDIENKIAAARRFFNNAVADYNTNTEQFPAVFIAKWFAFNPAAMFELAADEKAAAQKPPSVKF